jgi:hypothetical protein
LVDLTQTPIDGEKFSYTGTINATDDKGNEANTTVTIPIQNVGFVPQYTEGNPIRIGFGESKIYTTQQGNGRLIFGYVTEAVKSGYYDDNLYIEFPEKNDLQLNLDMRNL